MRDKILEAMRSRYACKSYDKEKRVSEEDFALLLEVARLSPSSFGLEPWQFLVVESEALKEKLYPIVWGGQKSFAGASHFVIILARKANAMRYPSSYIKHIMSQVQGFSGEDLLMREGLFEKFQKEDFQLDSERALFDWACKQTYIPLANMLFSASLMGIDACPIEGFNREKVEGLLKEEGILDSEAFGVSVMVSFGVSNKAPREKTRQKSSALIRYI